MFDLRLLKRITVVCGHYGCGKTNFSLNLAIDMAKKNLKVTIVDLDIINPYFRSSDYENLLKTYNIHIIMPTYAGTNLDTPALSTEIESVFEQEDTHIIFDVGGDDAGAFALGRYADKLNQTGYSFIYLVNQYRNLIQTPQSAIEILQEIKTACHLQPSYIVNNSHLKYETTPDDIKNSLEYGNDIARQLQLPLLCTTAPYHLKDNPQLADYDLYYIKPIVQPPFGI